MSLNGLDASAVVEAYHFTLADPGGWLLLRYENRDTVGLLSRGAGGVAEAKRTVEQYEEKSPLYGMLQYRRKRVLLKYVPDGTSRLLQVRLTVQFQSVLDALPHDAVFSFTTASELVESSLALCTMLQPTAGGSLKSSSSSLNQHRLNEISEDTEVHSTPSKREEMTSSRLESNYETRNLEATETNTLPASALRAKALLAKRKEENQAYSKSSVDIVPQPAILSTPLLSEPVPIVPESIRPSSSLSQLRARKEVDLQFPAPKVESHASAEQPKRYHHSRHLSENESESINQWNEQVAAYTLPEPKPKKKLAPRPHVEPSSRPKTATQIEDSVVTRPVANLPQSIRVSNRLSSSILARPGSQQSSRSVPTRFIPKQGMPPPLPEFSHLQPFYKRPESYRAGSVASSAVTDTPLVSPEKMRLMKALQKRKRDQLLTQRSSSAQPVLTTRDDDFPMGVHQPAYSPPVMPLPATIQEETTQPLQAVKPTQETSTASPTSVASLSENPSTRPSSLDEDQGSQSSQKSASIDTHSSSTPKAVAINARAGNKKHTSWYDSAPDLVENVRTHLPVMPVELPGDEPILRPKGDFVANNDQPLIEEHKPIQQDRSALSWLASDSQLNILQSLTQASEAEPADPMKETQALAVDSSVQPSLENSSVLSDDDALDDEFHDATVHEAKPMSVSRPPLTPTMRTLSIDRTRAGTMSTSTSSITPKSSRSTSGIQDRSPGQSLRSLQSSSTALPQWPPDSHDEPIKSLTKKSTLGQGISQRIKALEDSSRRESGMSTPSTQDSHMSRSTFSNLMKRTSFISQFQDKPQVKEVPKSTPAITSVAAKPATGRPRTQRQGSSNELYQAQSNTDSAFSDRYSPSANATEHGRHESEYAQLSSFNELHNTRSENLSTSSPDRKRFSFASYRSGSSAKWMTSDSMASRLSVATKDSKFTKPVSEASSINEEKRASRTSRLMKRISGFGNRSGGRTQQMQATREELRPSPIIEQNEAANHSEPGAETSMLMIDIGNVNVQFPETLLWKRRFLRIDDQGYLIFTAPTENQSTRATSRKFHLADIQEPCLPDLEREEMAWSVLLDLRDGNCIQCACESKQAQVQVLKMLLDAHGAFHSLYPEASD